MSILVVVNHAKNWPLDLPDVEVVSARTYVTDPYYARGGRSLKVFNLCRSYRYQRLGYYVSLLAEARGHRPVPDVSTIRDLETPTLVSLVSEELDTLIQKSLAPLQGQTFTLSIYFGRNLAQRYDRLSRHLFNLFPAPLLRATFVREDRWQLKQIAPIAVSNLSDTHRAFAVTAAQAYFAGRTPRVARRQPARYDVALLYDPKAREAPSDEKALQRFEEAGERLRLNVDRITKDDFGHLNAYDALFIRETTAVTNHTFRFARYAEAQGMVVIDDPASILRCTNKVFLAERMTRNRIPIPQTLIVHRDNVGEVAATVGLPCILKAPDSAFSLGVVKCDTAAQLAETARQMLSTSELIVAQPFLPTDFDWRIGVLDGMPLFASKYYMARKHWQIIHHKADGKKDEGTFDTVPIADAPAFVIDTAVRAANLIGQGLYGVDLKQVGQQAYVIEVNDNPNIDAGVEDAVLKDGLYTRIMQTFLHRIEAAKRATDPQ